MPEKLLVRRAAVLGAGVMGAQIAAHLANAGVDTVLFDLAAKDGNPDGVVLKAIAHLGKLSPAPLASKSLAQAIVPANYDTGLSLLEGCDLVIEAIAERMDWKQDLHRRIAPHVPAHAVLASNTSGLGINALAEVLPEELRHRVHPRRAVRREQAFLRAAREDRRRAAEPDVGLRVGGLGADAVVDLLRAHVEPAHVDLGVRLLVGAFEERQQVAAVGRVQHQRRAAVAAAAGQQRPCREQREPRRATPAHAAASAPRCGVAGAKPLAT